MRSELKGLLIEMLMLLSTIFTIRVSSRNLLSYPAMRASTGAATEMKRELYRLIMWPGRSGRNPKLVGEKWMYGFDDYCTVERTYE